MTGRQRTEAVDPSPPLRRATPEDAHALAELINCAGEGLPLHYWESIAEKNESAWDAGRRRARRETGGFSYKNAVVAEHAGRVAACLIGYPLAHDPVPIEYDKTPAMFLPLEELERRASGTWYINVVAAYPDMRGRGYGTLLLAAAEQMAAGSGRRDLSLIVSDANAGALRLYQARGYRRVDDRPMAKHGWTAPGARWLLLVKRL